MLGKKVVVIIFLLFVISFLPAQEIDRTLYRRSTLVENFSINFLLLPDYVEYFQVDVRFVRSFLWWEDAIRWEVASPCGRLTGVNMDPILGLLPPEEGEIITIFYRQVPGEGDIIDYWIETNR